MAITSYDISYLNNAQDTIGTMLDFAVNVKHQNIDTFFDMFIGMGIAYQFENGNPNFITGKNGIDLYQLVTSDYTTPAFLPYNKSPEYWVGWALTYYQWYSTKSFIEIVRVVPLSQIVLLYPTLHEADIMRFVETMDSYFRFVPTSLEIIRKQRGITIPMLATLSFVHANTIRNYENRTLDINSAGYNILSSLARALNCSPLDLLDKNNYYITKENNTMDTFYTSLRNAISENEQKINQLNIELAQKYDRLNSLKLGYVSQLPYEYMKSENNNFYINQNQFLNNWTGYWGRSLPQQNADIVKKDNDIQKLREVGKLALNLAIKSTGNEPLSLIADGYSLITANSLASAIASVAGIIDTLINK